MKKNNIDVKEIVVSKTLYKNKVKKRLKILEQLHYDMELAELDHKDYMTVIEEIINETKDSISWFGILKKK